MTRGFSSETFLYAASEEMKAKMDKGQECHVFYFGDRDPSGVAGGEFVERRLQEFGVDFEFSRVAVTEEQIRDLRLQTRPTKKSDSRARNFKGLSVELDAIHPDALRLMVRNAIESVLDQDRLAALKRAEELERESLMAAVEAGLFA